jgi:beta-lactamase regulating signal transducer with metallopeptidase domain
MAVLEGIISAVPEAVMTNISFMINLVQAAGIAILAYILFNLINFFFSRKREKELEKINKNLESIKRILNSQYKKK